jgi:hypothetical protein
MEAVVARHLFAILDDMTSNLAELKATLAPLALIGGTVVSEAGRPATSPQRRATGAPSRSRGPISAKRRAALRFQGQYMSAIRPLSAVQRAQVKKIRGEKGAEAAIALARRRRR